MNKIIKDACILFAITLVAGILLGLVYDVTKTPIANQNEKAKKEAYQAVLADADDFVSLSENSKYAKIETPIAGEGDFSADEVTEVAVGVDKNKNPIGVVITVVAGDGYGGDIKFSVGISTSGEYLGTSILSISETAGLGMRAKTDPSFLAQFNNKVVNEFKVVTDGSGSSSDDKVDAIGGSTVTSKAITKGINYALTVYQDIMSAGGVTIE